MTDQALKSVHIENHLVEKIHIEPSMTLTLNQQKLILYLASLINEYDTTLQEIELQISDFFKIIGRSYSSKSKELLEKSLVHLGSKVFFLPNESGDYKVLCRWLDTVEIDYRKNVLHLKLSETLAPYFLELSGKARTIFQFGYILQFRKSYSIDLYLYFCRFKNLNRPVMIPVDEALLRFGNGTYKRYTDLMRFVIKPATDEINEKSDLTVSFKAITESRKTTHICFYIIKKVGNQKLVAESWKNQYKKPNLKNVIEELFENDFIKEAQERNILSKNISSDDPTLDDFGLETLVKLKKHKSKVSNNFIEKANGTNLIEFLESVHPESVTYSNGNLVNADHDSLVIFGDGYYRYSCNESGTPVYYLTKYLNYNLNEAVQALIAFEGGSERTRTLVECPKSLNHTFYRPCDNVLANEAVKAYLTEERALSKNVIDRLFDEGKIYSASVKGQGKQYVCFSNNKINFYILRNTEPDGTQKLIISDDSYGFWFFTSESQNTRRDIFNYFEKQNEDYSYKLPLFVCESSIDAISLYELTEKRGIYVAMGGLKNGTFDNIINSFPNATEIILAVDNDPAGDKFCKYKNYKRIKPEAKDWNEDLQNKKRA
ncbi:MAG: RepB family plasmid replication initiator protein [[Clostridium] symbiosum]|uniref:Initiator RepB protein n=1 Tax=[Clostridium] symbiosum ATCC 14940 TaxID=411472 RepID=A0ABC9U273_CLOSY|nr:RepB family plasmid replication initiator protein [[Clostridium] symbiosum]ERI79429.1 initiator RepB protein [[Clostridium] symbiosum ATCC 14940]MBS6220121.1 RepB family plasmid replication initiator protein [[Clostridium] symbiosum]SUY61302.1 RepB family protein [[Clostridium] symbiosum]